MNSEGLTRVYVGGLNETIKKEDLQMEFEKFGKLNTVWMAFNPPGFAFIEFLSMGEAEVACSSMNGTEIKGAKLRVEISKGRARNNKFRGGNRNFGGNSRSFGGSRDYRGGGDRSRSSYGNSYGSGGGSYNKSFYGNSNYESSRNNDGYGYSSNSYYSGDSNYSNRRSTRYRSRSPVNRTSHRHLRECK